MKRFLKILALFLAPVILLLGMFSLALVRSGELTPTADIEAAALNGGLELFGLAYRDDTRALKQAVANARGADVLVLGTSRSMQLRGAFFASDSFYNAGGGIAYISQAQVFLENMPPDARPKHLLLVLDQYFYNETWTSIEPEDSAALRPYTQPDAFYALRRALADYLDGKYSLLHVLGTQDGVYGMSAAGRGAGFYADGSYTYGTAVLHPEKSVDAEFKDTFQRIAKTRTALSTGNAGRRKPCPDGSSARFLRPDRHRGNGIPAPYAPSVWQRMQETGQYGYIPATFAALETMFARYGFEVFDYSYLPETNDSQYVDGFHGSDRVYAALCARLAEDSLLLGAQFDSTALTALFTAQGNPLTVSLP